MENPPVTKGKVEGKVALVTGAASGIGRATAMTLASQGALVACADVDLIGATKTAEEIRTNGGKSTPYSLDVTNEAAWENCLQQVIQIHHRLEILVNCAGISAAGPLADMRIEEWRRVMSVNLEGVFLGTKHAIRAMRQNECGGSIINVSSVSGIKAQPEAAAYCASKAAVIMFTKSAALECLQKGDKIRINCISPSGVKTPMWKTMPFFQKMIEEEGSEEAAFKAMSQASPYGRWALPEEVAQAILFLASDDASYINGTNLVFDQGDTA